MAQWQNVGRSHALGSADLLSLYIAHAREKVLERDADDDVSCSSWRLRSSD